MELTLEKGGLTYPFHEITYGFNGKEILVHKPLYKVLDPSDDNFKAEYTGEVETDTISLEALTNFLDDSLSRLLLSLKGYQKKSLDQGAEGLELDSSHYCQDTGLYLALSFDESFGENETISERNLSGYFTFCDAGNSPVITSFELDLLGREVKLVNHVSDSEVEELPAALTPAYKKVIEISNKELEEYKATYLYISRAHIEFWSNILSSYSLEKHSCLVEFETLVDILKEVEEGEMFAATFNQSDFIEILPLLEDYKEKLSEKSNSNVENVELCEQYICGLKEFNGKEAYEGPDFVIGCYTFK